MLFAVERHLTDTLTSLLQGSDGLFSVLAEKLAITAAADPGIYREPAQASVIVRGTPDSGDKTLRPMLPSGHRITSLTLPTGQPARVGDDYYVESDPSADGGAEIVRLLHVLPGEYRVTTRGADVSGYRGVRPCIIAAEVRAQTTNSTDLLRLERDVMAALLRVLKDFPELDIELEPAETGWLRLGKPVATLLGIERARDSTALSFRIEVRAELHEVVLGPQRAPATVISAIVYEDMKQR